MDVYACPPRVCETYTVLLSTYTSRILYEHTPIRDDSIWGDPYPPIHRMEGIRPGVRRGVSTYAYATILFHLGALSPGCPVDDIVQGLLGEDNVINKTSWGVVQHSDRCCPEFQGSIVQGVFASFRVSPVPAFVVLDVFRGDPHNFFMFSHS